MIIPQQLYRSNDQLIFAGKLFLLNLALNSDSVLIEKNSIFWIYNDGGRI